MELLGAGHTFGFPMDALQCMLADTQLKVGSGGEPAGTLALAAGTSWCWHHADMGEAVSLSGQVTGSLSLSQSSLQAQIFPLRPCPCRVLQERG